MKIIYLVKGQWYNYKAFADKEKAHELSDRLWEEDRIYSEVQEVWFDDEMGVKL